MAKSKRNYILLLAPLALVVVWLVYGSDVFTEAAGEPVAAGSAAHGQFEQAADAVVAGAKESVAAAKNDQQALQKAQLSLEALRIIGMVGDFSTEPYADKLMSELSATGRPGVAEALVQMRFSSKLRQWDQLDDAARAAALDRFVADVKQTGLKPSQAKLLLQTSSMFGDQGDTKSWAKTINALLPDARNSKDAETKRIAVLLEGTVRRLELPGKPLEISGTLLDGKPLDWESYRGKVVLIDFFASWCGPCRAEVPNVLNYYNAYHDKGFDVIGVNLDSERGLAEEYIAQTGFHFPTIFGSEPGAGSWDLPVARRYGITAIPRVMLVDQKGNVVSTFARGEFLGQQLQKLLGPPSKPLNNTTGNTNQPSSVIQAGGTPADECGVVPAAAVEETSAPAPTDEPAPDTASGDVPEK